MPGLQSPILLQCLIAFQCAVFSLFLLVRQRGKRLSNVALGTLLGLLAAQMCTQAAQHAGLIHTELTLPQFFGFLYGPLFYLYVDGLIYRHPTRHWRDLLHALPFLAALMLWLTGLISLVFLAIGIFFAFGAYLVMSFLGLLRHQRVLESTRSDTRTISLRWLRFAISGLALIYLADVASFLSDFVAAWSQAWVISLVKYGLLLIYVNAFVFAALEHPELFMGIAATDENMVVKPAVQVVREPSSEDLAGAACIRGFMSQQRPYLQSELTLAELAAQLEMPARQVSEIINSCFHTNFSDFVNDYRVEAAKSRLTGPETRDESMLDILGSVGFNSKSSFNSIFKLKTGLSPSDYRRRHAN